MKYSFSFFLSFLSIGLHLTVYSKLYAQNIQQDKNMLLETISKHFVSHEEHSARMKKGLRPMYCFGQHTL
ncbi:Uncharacterised protein [Sphingobacterium mizutaii]|uniref:Uncharacterized protein n=1 Tax=Sphingobacterium mizutaii TaxID=1010 RepID=A0AAJ4X846_9SPHI|nr:hypothetical protein SAMN05192578_11247 [Sphingobacterium mizutaii]SNV36970.1 Uncharacterised protein [Sphingobacterium mizutaii]